MHVRVAKQAGCALGEKVGRSGKLAFLHVILHVVLYAFFVFQTSDFLEQTKN